MKTKICALFPGPLMFGYNTREILLEFKEHYNTDYRIELKNQHKISEQDFFFTFSDVFIDVAYSHFKDLEEDEYARARTIEYIFTQKYNAKLFNDGLLVITVELKNDWSDNIKKLAKEEVRNQFYHVSKRLFEYIRHKLKIHHVEYDKDYVYVGNKEIEGLCYQINRKYKNSIINNLQEDLISIRRFQRQINNLSNFPLTILTNDKKNAYHTLLEHYLYHSKKTLEDNELKFISTINRVSLSHINMKHVQNTLTEGETLSNRVLKTLDSIKEMYSFQLGVSSTFFEVSGFGIALISVILSSNLLLPILGLVVLLILYTLSVLMVFRYNTGPLIESELNALIAFLVKILPIPE